MGKRKILLEIEHTIDELVQKIIELKKLESRGIGHRNLRKSPVNSLRNGDKLRLVKTSKPGDDGGD